MEEAVAAVPSTLFLRFNTVVTEYTLKDSTLEVPAQFNEESLNEMIASMLQKDLPRLQFVVEGHLLRGKLKSHVVRHSLSCQQTLRVEYSKARPQLELNCTQSLSDWISSLTLIHHYQHEFLVSALFSGEIHIHSPPRIEVTPCFTPLHSIPLCNQPIHSIKCLFSAQPDTYHVVAGGLAGILYVVQTTLQQRKNEEPFCNTKMIMSSQLSQQINAIDVQPQELEVVCSVGGDGVVSLWKVPAEGPILIQNQKRRIIDSVPEIGTCNAHENSIESVRWLTSTQVATGSSDHSIALIQVERLKVARRHTTKDSIVTGIDSFGNTLLSAHENGMVYMWDLRMENAVARKSHKGFVSNVKYSTNSNVFATTGYDSVVKVWDCRSSFPLQTLKFHNDKVLAAQWINSSVLFTAGADSTIHCYNA